MFDQTSILEDQAEANVEALVEFTYRSNRGENSDGSFIDIDSDHARKVCPEDLGECVRRMLLTAVLLMDLDPAWGENMMGVSHVCCSHEWHFHFNKTDFFVTIFAPCYPETSSCTEVSASRVTLNCMLSNSNLADS